MLSEAIAPEYSEIKLLGQSCISNGKSELSNRYFYGSYFTKDAFLKTL